MLDINADLQARRAAKRAIRARARLQAAEWNRFTDEALVAIASDQLDAQAYRLRKAAQRESLWAQGEKDAWA